MGLTWSSKSLGWCFHSCLPSFQIPTLWKTKTQDLLIVLLFCACFNDVFRAWVLSLLFWILKYVTWLLQRLSCGKLRNHKPALGHYDHFLQHCCSSTPLFMSSKRRYVCVWGNTGIFPGQGGRDKRDWWYYGSIYTASLELFLHSWDDLMSVNSFRCMIMADLSGDSEIFGLKNHKMDFWNISECKSTGHTKPNDIPIFDPWNTL